MWHACVYVTCTCAMWHTYLYRLKPLDIEFMKQLHHLVNIIPVIAKADTLTAAELKALKLKVGFYTLTRRCCSSGVAALLISSLPTHFTQSMWTLL